MTAIPELQSPGKPFRRHYAGNIAWLAILPNGTIERAARNAKLNFAGTFRQPADLYRVSILAS